MTESKRIKTPCDELTYQIVGCAMAVHRHLGPGYREDTYQRDLEAQFTAKRIPYAAQKLLEVYDSAEGSVLIGYYIPDFIVDDSVIVEIKALNGLDDEHVAQVIAYLGGVAHQFWHPQFAVAAHTAASRHHRSPCESAAAFRAGLVETE